MGLRDSLLSLGRDAAGIAGSALLGIADNDFWKAESKSEENNEHAPGGSQEDSAKNAPVPTEAATEDPKSMFWDPFSVIEQLGYKDKPSAISYGTLRAIRWKQPIINAVIKSRVEQVASFAHHPSQDRYDFGFKFHKRGDTKAPLSPAEKKWAEKMNTFMLRTGVTDNPRGRDSLKTFVQKYMLDSLTYDQGCIEIVPNAKGLPAEFYAVDSSTIRLADSASQYLDEDIDEAIRYVQIYDGMIISEYTQNELAFGVRNPSTDIKIAGYGTSELEELMVVVTSLLWAWEYNQRAFSQGSIQKGILNFKGAVPNKQLKAFRRHWYQMLSGVENAWRTPITNAEELQWIDMQNSNRDMEYNAWFDFLIKVACAMYKMDPIEVNFKYGNTGQKSSMQDTHNSEKVIESRERGLRPLLTHLSDQLNRYIIWPINEGMELSFVGLDAATKDDVANLNQKRVKSTHTVNELRAEDGEDPIEGGDIILDPVFMQGQQLKAQEAAMAQGDDPFGDGDEEDGDDPDFQKLLDGDDDEEGDEEDKTTEGVGGRPGAPAKAAAGAKPGAGSAQKQPPFQKSLRKSRRKRVPKKRGISVDIEL